MSKILIHIYLSVGGVLPAQWPDCGIRAT